MSASTAIGRVSESLRQLLLEEMRLEPSVPVTLLAPDEPGEPRRINLFLYKVEESAILRNQDWQASTTASNELAAPPLSLNLFYIMTPYANNDGELGNASIHELLGEAMRVFYEHAIVPDHYLAGDLGAAREQVKIVPSDLDLHELGQLWGTFTQPFRLSVPYGISVVQLDQDRVRPVPPRVLAVGPPGIVRAHHPPVVERLDPTSGPPGSTITFFGRHLDGWSASVRMQRRRILDSAQISGDSFDVELPDQLAHGFHELRVDVAHLFRRTFLFEVRA
jgi:hypothetical protein